MMPAVAETDPRIAAHEGEVRDFVANDYAKVVAATALITGDRGDAEDAVQDAMVKAWQRRDEIENLAAWITVVASNTAKNRLRKKRNERVAVERLERVLAERQTDRRAEHMTLQQAITLLPERQRQAIVLHYYLDLSIDDSAMALAVHAGTIKTSLHRARTSLGLLIGDDDGGSARVGEDDDHGS